MTRNTHTREHTGARLLRITIALALALFALATKAQNVTQLEQRVAALERALSREQAVRGKADSVAINVARYAPQLHGILRGKYEYQPDMDASRFEVRNARISVSGLLPLCSEYKLEVDLCDESAIKMKDAWVRLLPWRTLRLSIGQQRLPFSIDAHRNPSAQYFANRSFIAKQVGDMRDVGVQLGYTFQNKKGRNVAMIDAGLFNGSNLDNEKTAWHGDLSYSARLQLFPTSHIALVPSIQHTAIAERKAHYTSLDFGSFYDDGRLHIEGEYLHKRYSDHAFSDCNAVDAMVIYRQQLPGKRSLVQAISYLARYDYMGDHSDGKKGFHSDGKRLIISDYERHRMTLGITLSLRNKYFPTDLRLNYENYWYRHGGQPKESEQDKLVAEVMVRF